VNYRIEEAQLIDLRGDILCPGDGLDVTDHDRFGLGQLLPGLLITGRIAGVQHNFMTLADEPIGGHEAETSG
jgi:hypothetical protein